MRVDELMTRRVMTVRAQDGLDRAARLMQDHACGCVPVVDEDSAVVGILTDRDVCMAALRADRSLSLVQARYAMSANVYTCSPEDTIEEAERRMGQHQVRRLPVVDADGRVRGILSLDDIAREAARQEGLIMPPVATREVGRTLGQITRPHLLENPPG